MPPTIGMNGENLLYSFLKKKVYLRVLHAVWRQPAKISLASVGIRVEKGGQPNST